MLFRQFVVSSFLLAVSLTSQAQLVNTPSSSSSTLLPPLPAEASTSLYVQPSMVDNNSNQVTAESNNVLAQEDVLKKAFPVMVTKALPLKEDTEATWQKWATDGWKNGNKIIDKDQAVIVVNRNVKVQQIAVMVAHPDGTWTLIGVSPTSTGVAGREKHFISPTGIFDHDGSIMDYRALGTKNENGIRGIGAKGSRVWDFGWQDAETGWLKTPEMRQIRFELHATDPDILEPRLGHPASAGCIRISAGLNKFLDHYSLLDAVYVQEADAGSVAISALLPRDREPTLSGRYMLVVDEPLPEVSVATTVTVEKSDIAVKN
jgi:hypothetical protein